MSNKVFGNIGKKHMGQDSSTWTNLDQGTIVLCLRIESQRECKFLSFFPISLPFSLPSLHSLSLSYFFLLLFFLLSFLPLLTSFILKLTKYVNRLWNLVNSHPNYDIYTFFIMIKLLAIKCFV